MISENKLPSLNLQPDSNLNEIGIAETIINFISQYLSDFKINHEIVNPRRKEGSYNIQLEDFFQRIARNENTIFYFSGNRLNYEGRFPDLSMLHVKADNHSSIFDIECKRLNSNLAHVDQYVSGNTGGIERFKRNLHGVDLSYSAMIGYMEDKTTGHWLTEINSWIKQQNDTDNVFWKDDEYLCKTTNLYYKSVHNRVNSNTSKSIKLFHFINNIN